jgi:glycosyltransferase involved in cell wall biosynthesis
LVRRAGETYRRDLQGIADNLGLAGHVQFIDRYLTQQEITHTLRATDVYVTPYLDPNQITSGTLAYALGAGKAIVSTPYLHAAEALADGCGALVNFRDADGLADALIKLLTDPIHRATMERKAFAQGRKTFWQAVGYRTLNLYHEVLAASHAKRAPLPQSAPLALHTTAIG